MSNRKTSYWDNSDFCQFEISWPVEKYFLYDCDICADNRMWQLKQWRHHLAADSMAFVCFNQSLFSFYCLESHDLQEKVTWLQYMMMWEVAAKMKKTSSDLLLFPRVIRLFWLVIFILFIIGVKYWELDYLTQKLFKNVYMFETKILRNGSPFLPDMTFLWKWVRDWSFNSTLLIVWVFFEDV